MSVNIRSVLQHLVQTSPDFSTWTTRDDVRCATASEGAGQIVGSAELHRRIGVVREPGATGSPASVAPLTGIVGAWVRILVESLGGSITVGDVDYEPIWWGMIDAEKRSDYGGGVGQQTWACSGLAAHLGRVRLMHGYTKAIAVSGAVVAEYVLRIPTFNAPESGGRSSSTYTVNGQSVYVFDFAGSTPWTAKQILDNLMASHAQWESPAGTFLGDLSWELSAGTLLDYVPPTIDLNGQSLLDAINALISPRRGLTWSLGVSGSTATITVRSVAAATIGDLPAATATATPDLTGLWISDVELLEDQSDTVDRIDVLGARPWVSCTLAFDPAGPPAEEGSLQPDWTITQENDWALGAGTSQDNVWRSFRLGIRWNGNIFDSTGNYGLRQQLELSGSDFTGGRTYDSAVDFPPGVHEITAELPCGSGFTDLPSGPRQAAFSMWRPSGSTVWQRQDGTSNRTVHRTLAVEEYPPAIHLGDTSASQQIANKRNLETDGILAVTVGMREPDPLCVSWTRSSASWPRSAPRQLVVQIPTAEQWVLLSGTIIGVTVGTSAGELIKQDGDLFIRNDLSRLEEALSFLRAYYAEPARSLSWTDRGTIDAGATLAPGVLITTATLGTGTATINAVVTRRRWTFTADGFGTAYDTQRIVPDVEAIR
jgi:hypothetical protein